ncbi:MAG: magnesium transporter [Bacteriovoracaceae bacterium]|nr:magnesium transporter [Bacteriovoracaceae bacterium]
MENLDEETDKKTTILSDLLVQGSYEELTKIILEMPTVEVCEFLNQQTEEKAFKVLELFPKEQQGTFLSGMDIESQLKLFRILEKPVFAQLFSQMASDARADFYQRLEKKEQGELLPFLQKKIRENVISLSSYPPDTAGGIMSTDFATIYIDMTAEEAMAKIREDAPSKKMIYYIYVVDHLQRMLGIVTIKELIMANPKNKIEDTLQEFFVYSEVDDDRESVALKIEKYSLFAIPVLNPFKQLVGIVNHDDAIEILKAEQTEDMEKFMGIVPSEIGENYLTTSSFQHFKKRVFWIVSLAAIGMLSGIIIHQYQNVLEQYIILAIYMPMMTATGGNSGSQSATLVIRALSLGEISSQDWLKILFKETKISFMISLCVAAVIYAKIYFLSFSATTRNFDLSLIALTISISLALQVMTAALLGAGLPLIVKKFGGDPAVAASPAITTAVDITGLLIYFTIATLLLNI